MKNTDDLVDDISRCEIITLATDSPAIKPRIMLEIVIQSVNMGKQIHYLDYDLQFSSLLQNLPLRDYDDINKDLLCVIQPTELLDWYLPFGGEMKDSGTIIVDSINTVQNMIVDSQPLSDTKTANYRCAVSLSILQHLARFYSKNILIVNLMRARPNSNESRTFSWQRQLVGGRMIRFKSDAILFASRFPDTPTNGSLVSRISVSDSSARFGGEIGDIYEVIG